MKIEALVLTQDEALQVDGCLASLAQAERIVVIDSGSTDATLEVVSRHPRVTIVQRPFTGFADQRNYGLDHHATPGAWVLHLDADERVTPDLWREMDALDPSPETVAFNVAARTFLRGRPVLRASGYPVYQTRLTRAGSFRFEQVGHGQKAPARHGPLPHLRHGYEHHPFEKGFDAWRWRHETYAEQEARDLIVGRRPRLSEAWADPISRRQWMKHATSRLGLGPAAIWAYLMLVRGGVLDGPAGWEYCRLRYLYEVMVRSRLRSLEGDRTKDSVADQSDQRP